MDNIIELVKPALFVAESVARGYVGYMTPQYALPYTGFFGKHIFSIGCCVGGVALTDALVKKTITDDSIGSAVIGTCLSVGVAFMVGTSVPHAAGSYFLYRTLFKAGKIFINTIDRTSQCVRRSFSPIPQEAV